MNDIELLDLISKGDTENLLIQKNLTLRLNKLASSGLIDICEGKIKITEKAINFQKDRKYVLLENSSIQKDMEEFSRKSFRRNSVYVYLCFALLCTVAIMLFMLIYKGI